MASMADELRVPHFLRVTRALALVSGIGLPLAGCGGALTTSSSNSDDSGASCSYCEDTGNSPWGGGDDGGMRCYGICEPPTWVGAYDGGGSGVFPYDGGASGVAPYDGGGADVDAGGMAYDGGPSGVAIYDGGLLGIAIPPDGGLVVGGPLIAPELPA
jgi:hypothetical protein